MSFIIQQSDGVQPAFFAPKTARGLGAGAGQGWVGPTEKDAALHFATVLDAETFLEIYLPHLLPVCTVIAHTRGEA